MHNLSVNLPDSPLARHAVWFFASLARVVETSAVPTADEIALHYSREKRSEADVQDLLKRLGASVATNVTELEAEVIRHERVNVVARLSNGSKGRFEFLGTNESTPKIDHFRYAAPLPDYEDEFVEGEEGQILVRRYGGNGTPTFLLHGGGMDASQWDFIAPLLLPEISPVALDLRGHGQADQALEFSIEGAIADIAAVARSLQYSRPVLIGHSLGGHVALEYATRHECRALVALDGPATLELGMTMDGIEAAAEPGRSFLAEVKRQDIRGLLDRLAFPAMFVLATGDTPQEREFMLGPRRELANHIGVKHPAIRVEWLETDHMIPLSVPEDAAGLVKEFITALVGKR